MQSSIFQNVMTLRPMDNAFDVTSTKRTAVEKKPVDDNVKKLREAIEQNISIPTESILYSEPESEPSSQTSPSFKKQQQRHQQQEQQQQEEELDEKSKSESRSKKILTNITKFLFYLYFLK